MDPAMGSIAAGKAMILVKSGPGWINRESAVDALQLFTGFLCPQRLDNLLFPLLYNAASPTNQECD
jgi:hypothetical protein